MKTTFKHLLMLTCIICLMSCSSDDDSSNADVNPEGTWVLTSLSTETAFDFNGDGIATKNLFEETPCYDGDYVKFESNGTARIVSALTDISADVTSPTDYTYNYECLTGFDIETSWTQTGNTITLQLQGNTAVGTISGNTMSVIIPNLFQMQLYNGTEYYNVSEDVTLVYLKS